MENTYIVQYLRAEKLHWWWIARRKIIARLIRKTLASLGKHQFTRALEIGCFSGMNVREFFSYAKTWVGVEPSTEAIAEALSNAPDLKIHEGLFPGAKPEGTFDAVFMLDVLEHIESPSAVLQSIFSSMDSGGCLFVTVPAYQWLWSSFDEMNHHFRRYTRSKLTQELRAAGFVVEYSSYFNSFLFLPAVIERLVSKLKSTDASGASATVPFAPINLLFKFIFSLERHILPYCSFPFGLSVIVIARRP